MGWCYGNHMIRPVNEAVNSRDAHKSDGTRKTQGVYHLGGDRWRVTAFESWDPNTRKQKQRTRVIHAPDRRSALRLAPEVKGDLLREIRDGVALKGTVAGAVAAWLDEAETRLSRTTMKGYRQIGAAIGRKFGRMKIDELEPSDVRSWYAKLTREGMSPQTLAHYHAVLRIVCKRAWNDRKTVLPATNGVDLAKPDQVAIRLPTDRAFLATIDHASGDQWVIQRLALATGMRRGELVALRWSDLHGRVIHVARALTEVGGAVKSGPTKGKRSRIVSIDDGAMRMLAQHRTAQVKATAQFGTDIDKRADRYLFANFEADPKGQTPYPPTWVTHGWIRTCAAAKVDGARFHDIRHRHATTLLDAGVPIHVVSARLGHAQVSTTLNIYAKPDATLDRVAARVIGQAMRALPKG